MIARFTLADYIAQGVNALGHHIRAEHAGEGEQQIEYHAERRAQEVSASQREDGQYSAEQQ